MVVVRFVSPLEEALNVLVQMGIYYIMMEGNVQVPKQSNIVIENDININS